MKNVYGTNIKTINKTTLVILSIIGLSIITGCVGNPAGNTAGNSPINPANQPGSDWCTPSKYTTKSTYGEISVEVKGVTDYKGHTVCETDTTSDQVNTVTYISQDGSYTYQIVKDKDGKVTNEGGTVKTK